MSVKSTRDEILEILRTAGESSVADLALSLGIAGPAVRRHLDILTAEHLVDSRVMRQHLGRPHQLYRLTDEAKSRAANGYPRLVERLIQEMNGLDRQPVTGQRLLPQLVERLGDRLAGDHRDEVHGRTLEERSLSLIGALASEGILDGVESQEDGLHLVNSACPHRRAAELSDAICQSELRAIETLLQTQVLQVGRIADGASRCDYLVCGPPAESVASVV